MSALISAYIKSGSWLRGLLLASGLFTFSGIVLFAFPRWPTSALAGVPAEIPVLYRVLAGLFMTSFAALYVWMAAQPLLPRGLVVLGAVAKLIAFAAFAALWVSGQIPATLLVAVSGDLLLAVLLLAASARTGSFILNR